MPNPSGIERAQAHTFDAAQREALGAFWRIYEPVQTEVQDEVEEMASTLPGVAAILGEESEEQRAARRAESIELQRRAFVEGEWAPYLANLHSQGVGYAEAGMAFSAWFDLIRAFRRTILQKVTVDGRVQKNGLPRVMEGMSLFVDLAMATIGEAYLETREALIERQRTAIRELSTPILQVHERLLLLPVVGVVDTDRAKRLTEELLVAIRRHRARVVVVDITGVPIVDSKVANHLLQTVDAAELMGASVVVTGISSEIAQTMVTIGADLARVRTLGDLRSGIEYAAAVLGLPLGSAGVGAGSSPPDAPGENGASPDAAARDRSELRSQAPGS